MKCKYCMSEIDVNAKICPQCRKRQKGNRVLGIIMILIGMLIMFMTIPRLISG